MGMSFAGAAKALWARNPGIRKAVYGAVAGGAYGGFSNNGSVLSGAAMGAGWATYGPRANKAAWIGAGAGAVYGGLSNNTSILGGATMGALAGAGINHYGVEPALAANRTGKLGVASKMIQARAAKDWGSMKLGSNNAINKIKGLYSTFNRMTG
jgi:hypothetical protein